MTILKKIGIVGCSNGRPISFKAKANLLSQTLSQMGIVPVWSEYIYEINGPFSGTAKERADSLMNFFTDFEITEIFDISGGDLSNEILPYLDFDMIAQSKASFWGYSDLTTVINAIYAKTGKPSVLYQLRNLISDQADAQIPNFRSSIIDGNDDLFRIRCTFVQKNAMDGILIGGNIRCLLKLAGTEYWPDMNGKILLLEAYNGGIPQMTTYLNQLQQMGVFQKISGILLGTFTAMERDAAVPDITDLVKACAGPDIPIAYTPDIGHGNDSKAIAIGKFIQLKTTA